MEAVAYIDELPVVEIKGGIAYTEMYSGGVCICRSAVRIDQFIRNVGVCNAAIAEWEARQVAVVVPMPVGAERLERQVEIALARH